MRASGPGPLPSSAPGRHGNGLGHGLGLAAAATDAASGVSLQQCLAVLSAVAASSVTSPPSSSAAAGLSVSGAASASNNGGLSRPRAVPHPTPLSVSTSMATTATVDASDYTDDALTAASALDGLVKRVTAYMDNSQDRRSAFTARADGGVPVVRSSVIGMLGEPHPPSAAELEPTGRQWAARHVREPKLTVMPRATSPTHGVATTANNQASSFWHSAIGSNAGRGPILGLGSPTDMWTADEFGPVSVQPPRAKGVAPPAMLTDSRRSTSAPRGRPDSAANSTNGSYQYQARSASRSSSIGRSSSVGRARSVTGLSDVQRALSMTDGRSVGTSPSPYVAPAEHQNFAAKVVQETNRINAMVDADEQELTSLISSLPPDFQRSVLTALTKPPPTTENVPPSALAADSMSPTSVSTTTKPQFHESAYARFVERQTRARLAKEAVAKTVEGWTTASNWSAGITRQEPFDLSCYRRGTAESKRADSPEHKRATSPVHQARPQSAPLTKRAVSPPVLPVSQPAIALATSRRTTAAPPPPPPPPPPAPVAAAPPPAQPKQEKPKRVKAKKPAKYDARGHLITTKKTSRPSSRSSTPNGSKPKGTKNGKSHKSRATKPTVEYTYDGRLSPSMRDTPPSLTARILHESMSSRRLSSSFLSPTSTNLSLSRTPSKPVVEAFLDLAAELRAQDAQADSEEDGPSEPASSAPTATSSLMSPGFLGREKFQLLSPSSSDSESDAESDAGAGVSRNLPRAAGNGAVVHQSGSHSPVPVSMSLIGLSPVPAAVDTASDSESTDEERERMWTGLRRNVGTTAPASSYSVGYRVAGAEA